MLVRNGMAEPATIPEAMRILERAKAAGLAQTADNVERDVGYMCNCCGCCCAMMNAIRRYDIRNAIVSSNWIMEVDRSQCNGCGDCVDACPVRAISLEVGKIGRKKRRWAVRDEALCLGCGTCHPTCKYGGIGMTAREQRVFTPETTFDRMVTMAIERGKLANLIFNEPEGLADPGRPGEHASREGGAGGQAAALGLPERARQGGCRFLERSQRRERRLTGPPHEPRLR
jgi:Na+-translocating ferredoxin:NAD+ oxidoreductase RNF subunit RnfB